MFCSIEEGWTNLPLQFCRNPDWICLYIRGNLPLEDVFLSRSFSISGHPSEFVVDQDCAEYFFHQRSSSINGPFPLKVDFHPVKEGSINLPLRFGHNQTYICPYSIFPGGGERRNWHWCSISQINCRKSMKCVNGYHDSWCMKSTAYLCSSLYWNVLIMVTYMYSWHHHRAHSQITNKGRGVPLVGCGDCSEVAHGKFNMQLQQMTDITHIWPSCLKRMVSCNPCT